MIVNKVQFYQDKILDSFPTPITLERETQFTSEYRNNSGFFNGLFVYTEKGRGCFQKGRRIWQLLPGTAYACCGKQPDVRYYYPKDSSEPWTFWWVSFCGKNAESMLSDIITHYGPVYKIPPSHPVITRYNQWLENGSSEQFITSAQGADMIFSLLSMLAGLYSKKTAEKKQSKLVLKAKKLILDELEENITCEKTANTLGISREHFSRQFKAESGISPAEFIIKCKMQRGCGLLQETAKSVKEIAFILGYEDSSNFIRVFKKHQQMTPAEFRKSGAIPRF